MTDTDAADRTSGPTNAEREAMRSAALHDAMVGEQNFPLGIGLGILAALISAVVWAAITLFSGYQIGWIAVGVGVLVGITVRHFGKGIETRFAVGGALLALFGCALGNFLAAIGSVTREEALPLMQVIDQIDSSMLFDIWKASFRPMDLLFYAIAAYEGYKLSLRQLPPPAQLPAAV
jgi:uncharacterized membrane protein